MLILLAALAAAATAWFFRQGFLLYYGDAQAHLNIARRIIDSRTPGYEQIGTVWLPLPHALIMPFVRNDEWWRTGLAGAIPSTACFVVAGMFLYAAARRAFRGRAAAAVVVLLLSLNPNLLYLQSTAMTESVFCACLAGLVYFSLRVQDTRGWGAAIGAGVAAMAGSLTRYEGWFVIPFAALFVLLAGGDHRFRKAVVFSLIAGLGPLYWLAHNWWGYSNPLEFFDGPYSAKAIYARALAEGMERYPGDGDWVTAVRYFSEAVRLCLGWPLVWLGVAGGVACLLKRVWWPVFVLALPPAFYVLSLYSSGTPIFVPHLWPNSYYNTRYGLAALPLAAFCAGGLVALSPARIRPGAATLLVLTGVSMWLVSPSKESWITWKESQVNSDGRRAWTHEAAQYLKANCGKEDGILTSFGDLAGIFPAAGIPLRRILHEGNRPDWDAALARPEVYFREKWVVAMSGDRLATTLLRAERRGLKYSLVRIIAIKGAPVIEIYRREGYAYPIHESARREE